MTRTMIAAAAIIAVTAGSAFAQSTSAVARDGAPFATEEERAYYNENRARYEGFFTDADMMELRPDEEITSAFDAMGQEDRDSIIAQCQRAYALKGSYGTVTTALCNAVGVERPTGG